jgi:hypothetical protein
MKLKKSHLTGQTAIQAANIITREFEKVIPGFIASVIGPSITPERCWINADRLLYPVITTQGTLRYFIDKGRHVWITNWWVREVTANHKDDKVEDFTLMFNDSVRLDVIAEYRGKPATWAGTDTYYVKVIATILNEQMFLDSLGIQPIKEPPRYVDILGNEVHTGDVVVVSGGMGARLYVDKVKKLTPRSIVLDGGTNIPYKVDYDNRLVVVSDLPYNKSK